MVDRLPGVVAETWDWQLRAACRSMETAVFFMPDGSRGPRRTRREQLAKSVCQHCPVLAECLDHALRVREPFGVWGGLTEREREELRGRGRPRSGNLSGPGRARRQDMARVRDARADGQAVDQAAHLQ
jgi:WhiB family transcriptional regulator, redox-sensing transcriptional regulator